MTIPTKVYVIVSRRTEQTFMAFRYKADWEEMILKLQKKQWMNRYYAVVYLRKKKTKRKIQ